MRTINKISVVLVALLLGSCDAPFAPSLDVGKAEQADAMKAYQAGALEQSIEHFKLALKNRPGHPNIVMNLALISLENGKLSDAIEYIEQFAHMGLSADLSSEEFNPLRESDEYGEKFAHITAHMAERTAPLNNARLVFETSVAIPLSEGLAYAPEQNSVFVSSIYGRKIVKLSDTGVVYNFVDGLEASPMALWYDQVNHLLWAATTILPQSNMQTFAANLETGLMAFNMDGVRVAHFNAYSDFYKDVEKSLSFGDIVGDMRGNIYISNSLGNEILAINTADGLKPKAYVVDNAQSLQGLALLDEKTLVVADYSTGLHIINLKTGTNQWLAVPDEVSLIGIDGLYAHEGKLIAIQNGVRPYRVLEISLSKDRFAVSKVRVLDQALADFSEPTNGTLVGDKFYFIANSGWIEFGDMANVKDAFLADLAPLKVFEMALKTPQHP